MNKKSHIILNFILSILLIVIVIRENYIWRSLSIFKPNVKYQIIDNNEYVKQLDLYSIYRKSGRFVMLGNSITQGVNWNELFNRDDILNRGIGNDILEGILKRIDNIETLKVKVCFIMAGINDINLGIDSSITYANYSELVAKIKSKNITPVIQSTLYVSSMYPNAEQINFKVKLLNDRLKTICKKQKIPYLNLNKKLSLNNELNNDYTYDGIHLNSKGYREWRGLLAPVLDSISNSFETQNDIH